MASVEGRLDKAEMTWNDQATVCVVMASGGYPGSYTTGKGISGLGTVAELKNVKVFHAGTALKDGAAVTNGGRVLGVTAWADDLRSAREAAYGAVKEIHFENAHYRNDIASKAL